MKQRGFTQIKEGIDSRFKFPIISKAFRILQGNGKKGIARISFDRYFNKSDACFHDLKTVFYLAKRSYEVAD